MAAPKGHKKYGGRAKGAPNKRTEQWEQFVEYCMNGGLEKFQTEMEKLTGKDYVSAFANLLEFHKPKLARTELTGSGGKAIILQVKHETTNLKPE